MLLKQSLPLTLTILTNIIPILWQSVTFKFNSRHYFIAVITKVIPFLKIIILFILSPNIYFKRLHSIHSNLACRALRFAPSDF